MAAPARRPEPSRRSPDTAAIIVAGGKGLRFGAPIRKQYMQLQGRPVLWWSLQAFQKSPSIQSIILVVPVDDVKRLSRRMRAWGLSKLSAIVAGGVTRAHSVREGLKALTKSVSWVAVHDAVRPLVQPELIEQTLRQARRWGAAIAAAPSKDTVKLSNGNGCIASTPPRKTVWLAQTPQIFERRLLEKAHHQGRHLPATDDAQLVERMGVRVRLVQPSFENIKVTVPSDLAMAKIILKDR